MNSLLDIYLASFLQRLLDVSVDGTLSRLIALLKESVVIFIVYMTVVIEQKLLHEYSMVTPSRITGKNSCKKIFVENGVGNIEINNK